MKPTKILGREPAVFFGLLAAVLLALIRFVPFTVEVSGALNATVLAAAGFATAATVSAEKALPALVGLVQAVFAVFLAYGSPVPESTQAGILALIAALGSFFVRQNVYARLGSEGEDRLTEAYRNGYQSGLDDMTYPSEQEEFAGDGAHSHTEIMPAVIDKDRRTT